MWMSLLVISFLVIIIYMYYLLYISQGTRNPGRNDFTPNVSVLLAFRNEEENLPACIESLQNLDYPVDRLDILLIDDGSEDSGHEFAVELIRKTPHIRVVDVVSDERNGGKGKMEALRQGINHSSGEVIFITDADCRVEASWIQGLLRGFDQETGMVGGFTDIGAESAGGIARLQNTDMLYLQTVSGLNALRNKPLTILGNNMAFRRTAYEDVGGYEALPFSITEDFALMDAMDRHSHWKIKYIFPHQDEGVQAEAEASFGEFMIQRLRWVRGGLTAPVRTWATMLLLFLIRILILVLLPASFLDIRFSIPALIIYSADFIFIRTKAPKRAGWNHVLLWEVFSAVYAFLLFLSILSGKKVTWKGRRFP